MRGLMGLAVLLLWGDAAFAATECARVGDVVIYRAPEVTGQFMIGITITHGAAAIIGWAADGHWHVDAAIHDQATAVQIILDDNGYRKVHALDRQGVDHYWHFYNRDPAPCRRNASSRSSSS